MRIVLLESLNGEHKEQVSPIGALKFILERHISNLDNWAINMKVLIIIHRSLQNIRVNRKIIKDLKKIDSFYKDFAYCVCAISVLLTWSILLLMLLLLFSMMLFISVIWHKSNE